MALSQGNSALWSDIVALFNNLATVQEQHGQTQITAPNQYGAAIKTTEIQTLYNAASTTHDESHLASANWVNITIPSVGALISPDFINTLSTNINNMKDICHYNFSFCFDFGEGCFSGPYN